MGLFSYLLESDLRAINWLRWLTLRQLWLSHKEPMPTLMYTWLCEVYAHMCTWLGRPCAHAVARGRHVCSTLSLSAWFLWDMASYWTWSWTGNQQEPVILASALLQHWGYATKGHSPLCVFAGDLNSSPHACVAIALTLSKLFPHPIGVVLSKQPLFAERALLLLKGAAFLFKGLNSCCEEFNNLQTDWRPYKVD